MEHALSKILNLKAVRDEHSIYISLARVFAFTNRRYLHILNALHSINVCEINCIWSFFSLVEYTNNDEDSVISGGSNGWGKPIKIHSYF